eukprot:tig00001264_g7877.t1
MRLASREVVQRGGSSGAALRELPGAQTALPPPPPRAGALEASEVLARLALPRQPPPALQLPSGHPPRAPTLPRHSQLGAASKAAAVTATLARPRPFSGPSALRMTVERPALAPPAHIDEVVASTSSGAAGALCSEAFEALGVRRGEGPGLFLEMLELLALPGRLGLERGRVLAFAGRVLGAYSEGNAFHGPAHALDVAQATFLILARIPEGGPGAPDAVERVALMCAALAHDAGHPGLSNSFLQHAGAWPAGGAPSPLERASAALLLAALADPATDIAAPLAPAARARLATVAREAVLATDIALSGEYLAAVRARLAPFPRRLAPHEPGARLDYLDDRTLLCCLVLKCADLVNAARPWESSQAWAARVQAEFYRQGALERALGLSETPWCQANGERDGGASGVQARFVSSLCLPLYEALAAAAPGAGGALLGNVRENGARWARLHAAVLEGDALGAAALAAPGP